MSHVEITIEKNGDVASIRAVGCKGPNACYAATKPYDVELDPSTKTDKKTPDYYKTETIKVRETE